MKKMNLNELSKQHIERLSEAISQSKQAIAGHEQKIKEFTAQLQQLESEKVQWEKALEEE